MTYADGTRVFRELSEDERLNTLRIRIHEEEEEEVVAPRPGEFLDVNDDETEVHVVAMALDPTRADEYARAQSRRKCKADSAFWCSGHRRPA